MREAHACLFSILLPVKIINVVVLGCFTTFCIQDFFLLLCPGMLMRLKELINDY